MFVRCLLRFEKVFLGGGKYFMETKVKVNSIEFVCLRLFVKVWCAFWDMYILRMIIKNFISILVCLRFVCQGLEFVFVEICNFRAIICWRFHRVWQACSNDSSTAVCKCNYSNVWWFFIRKIRGNEVIETCSNQIYLRLNFIQQRSIGIKTSKTTGLTLAPFQTWWNIPRFARSRIEVLLCWRDI